MNRYRVQSAKGRREPVPHSSPTYEVHLTTEEFEVLLAAAERELCRGLQNRKGTSACDDTLARAMTFLRVARWGRQ